MERRTFLALGIGGVGAMLLEGCSSEESSAPAPVDGGTLPPEPSSSDQFLTWDGGSGPTNGYWSRKLELPWVHENTGDYLDAAGLSQGSEPYATVSVSAPGAVSVDVTTLVSRWISTGVNRGFYLRSNESWPFVFVGRGGEGAAVPTLTIVTDQGTFTPRCRCNADWSPSSAIAKDTRASFRVSGGTNYAIVQFDLAGVVGTVESATLALVCTECHTPGTMEVLEADPPRFYDGGGGQTPTLGIAQAYAHDEGIASHASVLFAADFADIGEANWQTGSVADGYSQEPDEATGTVYLRAMIPEGENGGCSLEHTVVGATDDGVPDRVETELYARYYVWLDEDWGSTVDGNKMPGFDGRFGWWNPVGYWQNTTGNGGTPGTGLKVWNATASRWEYEGCSMRGHGGTKAGDGNPYDDLFWIGGYVYHLDQGSAYGEGVKWTGYVLGKGKWYCIEHYIKMNTISEPFDADGNGTANPDGEYRAWVDGVLVYERSDFRWTRHPELGIQGFWLNWYHGGTAPAPSDMHFRMNSVVIAREYIGPRNDG